MVDTDGINEETGTVNVYKLLPDAGDSILIVNCGDHYEVRHHTWKPSSLELTPDDIDKLKQGRIVWN